MAVWAWRSLRAHHYRRVSEDDKGGRISQTSLLPSSRTSSPAPQMSFLLWRLFKRKWIAVLLVLCMAPAVVWLTLLHLTPSYPLKYHSLTEITFPTALDDLPPGTRNLVIVLPANSPSPDLCKVMASAVALGYPTPIIVNWGKHFRQGDDSHGSSHLAKITGTLEYLEAATRFDARAGKLDEDDLVLVLDAYDVWFQLPPEVLLMRYHQELTAANKRLREQWGAGSQDDMPMKQTIVASSQKSCWPFEDSRSGYSLHCDALPNSTLPEDLFGDHTDVPSKQHHEMRPRFFNSGSIMGPAGDMRRYFRRVKERMDRTAADGWELQSDQAFFAEMMAEQEIWRRWRLGQHERGWDEASESGPGLIQESFEFHVGLDYTQQLFLPTVYVEKDGDLVALGREDEIKRRSDKLGISPPRVRGTPADVVGVRNPLDDILPTRSAWEDMPLYVDFFMTAVPVLVHHNAWHHGLKERRTTWWDRTWYFPHLRRLMEMRMTPNGRRELAKVGNLRYMTPGYESGNKLPKLFVKEDFRKTELRSAGWGDVCKWPDETEGSRRWYDEVFRDGLGPL